MKKCHGKHCYPKREAEGARNHRLKSRHKRPDHLRIYSCPRCGWWHLTHKQLETEDTE